MAFSTGSKRSATSAVTTAAATDAAKLAAFKKNTNAYKKVIDQQQKSAKFSSVSQTIQGLQAQISGSNGFRANYSKNQGYLSYDQNMIATGTWGSDPNYNNIIYNNNLGMGVTPGPAPGSALSLADKTAIYADIASTTVTLDALLNKISQTNALIDASTKVLGVPAGGKTIIGSSSTGYSRTNTPPPSKAIQIKTATSQASTTTLPPEFPNSSYKWNLPPHAWSLPTDPVSVNPGLSPSRIDNHHSSRRGRIWVYTPRSYPVAQVTPKKTATNGVEVAGSTLFPSAYKYGFQFLWNPETYSQNTGININITPNANDPGIALTGLVNGSSQISFTLRIDRTNDFACAKGMFLPFALDSVDNSSNKDLRVQPGHNNANNFVDFYSNGHAPYSSPTETEIAKKITELMKYGTEADLEYLYRVINGDTWKGIGRNTSNIGFLQPQFIRIDLGQNKFTGVISSISVNHLAFTRDMVPIRSDVNLTINLLVNVVGVTNNTGSSTKTK